MYLFYAQLFLLLCLAVGCDGLNEEETTLEPGSLSLAHVNLGAGAANSFELGITLRHWAAAGTSPTDNGDSWH